MDEQKRQALLAMAQGIEDVAKAVRSLVDVELAGGLCGVARVPVDDTPASWTAKWPCTSPVGHTDRHIDRDGDAF
jgi:hypothetical protein